MSRIRNSAVTLITGSALIVSVALILSAGGLNSSSSDANLQTVGSVPMVPSLTASVPVVGTVTVIPPITSTVIFQGTPITVINRRPILAGKSPDEIAQYAVQHFAPSFLGPRGTTEIVLARPITREEMPVLGLGCLPENGSSEEPPYVLVILRGDFTLSGMPGGRSRIANTPGSRYAGFVIDVWAAGPTAIIPSASGGEFRTLLNDPTLPIVNRNFPTSCAPRVAGPLPHGAVLPGVVFPTIPPAPTTEVIPTPTLPLPIGTVSAPTIPVP